MPARGSLFPADNAEALAERLCAIMERRAEWPVIQEAARRFAETQRTWDACTTPHEALYRQVLSERRH